MPVDLPRDVALGIREVGFDAWLEEVWPGAVRNAEKVGAYVPIEKERGEMTRQEKTGLRVFWVAMAAKAWREVVIEKLLPRSAWM